ncbi:type VII secretion target [Actinosynnema sp. NPDC020468]|uniref:type VII secretion target n=1 Tax=Actinosynnema sp. NPDC020468 TaxID=3154488 RepID=UPI0034057B57
MGFDVSAGELRAHADKVEGHSTVLGQAVDAAGYAMSDRTYGRICAFLPPVFNDLEEVARTALESARSGLFAIAAKLRDTAATYETEDEAIGRGFSGIGVR